MEIFIWLGIIFCALKAAVFSGLNLAYFSIPFLRLKVLTKKKDPEALKILALREQPNFLLSTILWGNVSYNVLLALLANSVMAGMTSFFFSTIVLTLVGEILPQATFSRQALKFGAFFAPMIKFYEFLLYPIAKPTAMALDYFLGKESPRYYSERDLIALIEEHLDPKNNLEISSLEGKGAIHFLELDDRLIKNVGRDIEEKQISTLNFKSGKLLKNDYVPHPEDKFLSELLHTSERLQIITDAKNEPKLVLDTDRFIKSVFATQSNVSIRDYATKPIVVTDSKAIVSEVLKYFVPSGKDQKSDTSDISNVAVIYWTKKTKKILTSDDLVYLLMQELNPSQ